MALTLTHQRLASTSPAAVSYLQVPSGNGKRHVRALFWFVCVFLSVCFKHAHKSAKDGHPPKYWHPRFHLHNPAPATVAFITAE